MDTKKLILQVYKEIRIIPTDKVNKLTQEIYDWVYLKKAIEKAIFYTIKLRDAEEVEWLKEYQKKSSLIAKEYYLQKRIKSLERVKGKARNDNITT